MMSDTLARMIRDMLPQAPAGGKRVESTQSVGDGPREVIVEARADKVGPTGWLGHKSLDQGLLLDAGLVGWHEVEQVLEGADIMIDLRKGSAVVWHLPGSGGSATISGLPGVPSYQILQGAGARKRTYGCTIRIVWGSSADARSVTLPGGMGDEPFEWSLEAGKIDTVVCSYSEALGRWFAYPAGRGH